MAKNISQVRKRKFSTEKEILTNHLTLHNLKLTKQREYILYAFLNTEKHVTAEGLLYIVRKHKKEDGIGLSTIYRTMKLLCDCGLAQERMFGDGQSRFEHYYNHSHHDHMVCTVCGNITEFEDDRIEKLQEEVAKQYDFDVFSHRLELFGQCSKCMEK